MRITGYRDTQSFIRPYLQVAEKRNPGLRYSLNKIQSIRDHASHFQALPSQPNCLIQGFSDPSNADELVKFLSKWEKSEATLHAIDLHDVPKILTLLGIKFPEIDFTTANAADLQGVFETGSCDVIVQDFLLNCTPPVLHTPILNEVRRLLSEEGIALISFTVISDKQVDQSKNVSPDVSTLPQGWNPCAYSIDDIDVATGSSWLGKRFYCNQSQSIVYVTPETGNFEFYRSYTDYVTTFLDSKLRIAAMQSSDGTDAHGQHCRRYHCIIKPT